MHKILTIRVIRIWISLVKIRDLIIPSFKKSRENLIDDR